MRNLGAVEAANGIRHDVFNMPGIDPAEQHQIRFVQSVCAQLGLDHSPENMHKVATALHKHDIGVSSGQEFPKYATRDHDGSRKVVHNEEEEKKWVEEPPPEAVKPLGPLVQGPPPHQAGLDLTRQVPQSPELPKHPAGRVASAVTNREAAQDAYARQPIEDQARDSGHVDDGTPAGAGPSAHDDHVGDGEVHVENLAPTGASQQGGSPYAKPADVGVMAHDDADGDGIAGQDANPTHDSVLGTDEPQPRSGDSSAGKTDTARRPVDNRRPQ